MARVRCQCGQAVNVTTEQIGKVLACPHCKKRFKVTAPRTAETQDTNQRGFTFIEDRDSSHVSMARSNRTTRCARCNASLSDNAEICVHCGHVNASHGPSKSTIPQDSESEPRNKTSHASGIGSYLRSCAKSLLVITDIGNFITIILVMILMAMNSALTMLGFSCVLIFPMVILTGILSAFFFNVVVNASNGDDDLPEIGLSGDWFDDIIIPFVKFLTTCLITLAPLQIYRSIVGDNAVTSEGAFLMLGIGVFLWPIIILTFAIGGLTCLVRPDRMLATIFRTFVPYVFTCAALAGAIGISWGLKSALKPVAASMGGNGWAIMTILSVVDVYCMVVAMQCIGLYYHHFKDRFAWNWG